MLSLSVEGAGTVLLRAAAADAAAARAGPSGITTSEQEVMATQVLVAAGPWISGFPLPGLARNLKRSRARRSVLFQVFGPNPKTSVIGEFTTLPGRRAEGAAWSTAFPISRGAGVQGRVQHDQGFLRFGPRSMGDAGHRRKEFFGVKNGIGQTLHRTLGALAADPISSATYLPSSPTNTLKSRHSAAGPRQNAGGFLIRPAAEEDQRIIVASPYSSLCSVTVPSFGERHSERMVPGLASTPTGRNGRPTPSGLDPDSPGLASGRRGPALLVRQARAGSPRGSSSNLFGRRAILATKRRPRWRGRLQSRILAARPRRCGSQQK